jgi:hypothetical protein
MKHLTFDEVIHYGNGRYAIDWENGERKYKEPFQGIKVYEHGLIEVCRNGARDPSWRRHVFNTFKLDFRTMPGFGNLSFFDPNTGRKVPKKYMGIGVLLYDRVWGRVYAGNGWGSSFTSLSEHAQPTSKHPVTYRVPNKQRYDERMAQLAEHFALGETLNALRGDARSRGYLGWGYERMIVGDKPIPTDLTTTEAQEFCQAVAAGKVNVEKKIYAATRDVHTTPYLIVKEN